MLPRRTCRSAPTDPELRRWASENGDTTRQKVWARVRQAANAAYARSMLGREKQDPWLGKPEHVRIATIAVYVFGGLMLLLVVSAFVAAFVS